jgi:hypothetical protein
MKLRAATFAIFTVIAASFGASPAAAQTTDDVNWINRCVSDNKDEGQTNAVLVSYCTCMNNRMSSSETRSITAWEKSNPQAVEACAKTAGWKGK